MKNNPVTTLSTPEGASADIHHHGAHLTSWKTAHGKEWIFLSDKAQFAEGKAIRGGVPIIFPQFNAFGPGPRHGFARNLNWSKLSHSEPNQCQFRLSSNQSTLSAWPFQFDALFSVALSNNQLSMNLKITNTDIQPFLFTAALHTYFLINDINQASLFGLNNLEYWDNDGSDFQSRKRSTNNQLNFNGPIDRVYFNCNNPLQLTDENHQLSIRSEGFPDMVVWNPGAEDAKNMADMADDEYKTMLCVEAAAIDVPIELQPGEHWEGSQTLNELIG